MKMPKDQSQTAELTKPLRDLLSSKKQWIWSNAQDEAFRAIKAGFEVGGSPLVGTLVKTVTD